MPAGPPCAVGLLGLSPRPGSAPSHASIPKVPAKSTDPGTATTGEMLPLPLLTDHIGQVSSKNHVPLNFTPTLASTCHPELDIFVFQLSTESPF